VFLLLRSISLQLGGSINDDTPDVEAGMGGDFGDFFDQVAQTKDQIKTLGRYLDDIKRLQQSQLWSADTEGSGMEL